MGKNGNDKFSCTVYHILRQWQQARFTVWNMKYLPLSILKSNSTTLGFPQDTNVTVTSHSWIPASTDGQEYLIIFFHYVACRVSSDTMINHPQWRGLQVTLAGRKELFLRTLPTSDTGFGEIKLKILFLKYDSIHVFFFPSQYFGSETTLNIFLLSLPSFKTIFYTLFIFLLLTF